VLATLASRHRASGVDVWSGDKDLLQLVDMPGVRCLDYSGAHVDEAAVMVKFGVKASQIGDYLALVGDAPRRVGNARRKYTGRHTQVTEAVASQRPESRRGIAAAARDPPETSRRLSLGL